MQATLHTNYGDINLDLFENQSPKTVRNFTELATGKREWTDPATGKKSNAKFYDGVTFHRIINNFMIQGGDPLGTGTGGPGYKFDDEIHPELSFDRPYLLAMANAGKIVNPVTRLREGTNGSQFFITTTNTPHLNGKHTIFGEVADDASKAVVDKIESVPTGPGDRPLKPVVINSVTVTE
jgi:peptidyl-prolyl cis-trans isomerase A (cyclophilin A)